eukprot:768802-Hanusia_phi.AAC.1
MRFVSTRGGGEEEGIEEALRRGYARDGGLYVPKVIRKLEEGELEKLSRLEFRELCSEILCWFASDELSEDEVRDIVRSCFEGFSSDEIIPLTMLSGRGTGIDGSVLVAELFHGPSMSFKDFGQQVLCKLLNMFAQKKKNKISILVSTTGDTGPAAIMAARGLEALKVVVTYPHGQISRFQELQMTTEDAGNVFVYSFEGGGDDMDAPIKTLSTDALFQEQHGLAAVNSINIGRVIMQSVHYFWSYFRAVEKAKLPLGSAVDFALPCGALGNAAAGQRVESFAGVLP